MRGATKAFNQANAEANISIHAPRAGRDDFLSGFGSAGTISIHAPRAGRDFQKANNRVALPNFNPRAPCGARLFRCCKMFLPTRFQSTRPVRGATGAYAFIEPILKFQSTRPVRGATCVMIPHILSGVIFQSTRPVRGATS